MDTHGEMIIYQNEGNRQVESGKNKIPMAELKSGFIELGYIDVFTYLNSGNVVFSADERSEIVLADKIKVMIQERFELDIPVFIISHEELKDLLSGAPVWWGTDNKEIYDNLILVMPPAIAEIIVGKIGEPTKELEQICICKNAIFWSFDRKNYAKANWWKKQQAQELVKCLQSGWPTL